MLDDDFRMLTGRGGCFCPLHIAGFNRITGKNYTAETLREAIRQDKSVARAYDAWLKDLSVNHGHEDIGSLSAVYQDIGYVKRREHVWLIHGYGYNIGLLAYS